MVVVVVARGGVWFRGWGGSVVAVGRGHTALTYITSGRETSESPREQRTCTSCATRRAARFSFACQRAP